MSRRPEDLPSEFVAPAAGELMRGLVADPCELAFELAREATQLVRSLLADLAENSFVSFRHLFLAPPLSRQVHSPENRPPGPKSLALASPPQRNGAS